MHRLVPLSTARQGRSGLRLDAQRTAVLRQRGGELRAEFTEMQSGKDNARPQLNEAINLQADKFDPLDRQAPSTVQKRCLSGCTAGLRYEFAVGANGTARRPRCYRARA